MSQYKPYFTYSEFKLSLGSPQLAGDVLGIGVILTL